MKIAKYVGDLLFDYECVVVPGLGGFLTSDRNASINQVTHHFKPPFRNVTFNVHLRANDGLLVNHIAQQEDISYKAAKQKVDQFVHICHRALEEGKRINFKGVGSIYRDKNSYIVFEQDTSVNYNPDTFGLSSFISPAVRRPTEEEKIREFIKPEKPKKTVDRKLVADEPKVSSKRMVATRKKSALRKQMTILSVAFLAVLVYYTYSRRDAMSFTWNKWSNAIPAFYASPNDFIEKNAGNIPSTKITTFAASIFPKESTPNTFNKAEENAAEPLEEMDVSQYSKPITTKEADKDGSSADPEAEVHIPTSKEADAAFEVDYVQKMDASEVVPETEVAASPEKSQPSYQPAPSANSFFIIAGSFNNENNARKLVASLKNSGFDALIADTNKYGMFRVAFMAFSSQELAEEKLAGIRRENNSQAWILKK